MIDNDQVRQFGNLIVPDDTGFPADKRGEFNAVVPGFSFGLSDRVDGVHGQDLYLRLIVSFSDFLEMRNLRMTLASIGLPEVEDYDLTGKIGQSNFLLIDGL